MSTTDPGSVLLSIALAGTSPADDMTVCIDPFQQNNTVIKTVEKTFAEKVSTEEFVLESKLAMREPRVPNPGAVTASCTKAI